MSRRDRVLKVRLSSAELEKLERLAGRRRLAEYVRSVVLGGGK